MAILLFAVSLGALAYGMVMRKPWLIVLGLVGMGMAFAVPAEVAG